MHGAMDSTYIDLEVPCLSSASLPILLTAPLPLLLANRLFVTSGCFSSLSNKHHGNSKTHAGDLLYYLRNHTSYLSTVFKFLRK